MCMYEKLAQIVRNLGRFWVICITVRFDEFRSPLPYLLNTVKMGGHKNDNSLTIKKEMIQQGEKRQRIDSCSSRSQSQSFISHKRK